MIKKGTKVIYTTPPGGYELRQKQEMEVVKKRGIWVIGWVSDEDFKHSFEDNVKDTFDDELADIMIRVMDLATFKGVDLEQHIKAKMRYNSLREHKHGKKY